MKAYCALHTARPTYQLENEVSYEGYRRIEIDFKDDMGREKLECIFPIIEADSADIVRYFSIGAHEKGQGQVFMVLAVPEMDLLQRPERLIPAFWIQNGASPEQAAEFVKLYGYIAPTVIFCNDKPIDMPDDLNPIAKKARLLYDSGLMLAEELHPQLYEMINDALAAAGVPIIPCIRQAAAKIDVKIDHMPSLAGWIPEQDKAN